MDLSIVIPALNEEKTIGPCIRKGLKAIADLGLSGEVLVADNGSTDRTVAVAREAGARVVSVRSRGYGSALTGGFREAAGKFLIMGDADDSYDFGEIAGFVRSLNNGFDFVMGNRFQGTIEPGAMPSLHRYLGTPVLTQVMNVLFRTKIGDVNCGMRALTKEAFRRMHLKTAGMEFATEMIIKAALVGLRIDEIPCNLYRDKRDRRPHLNSWRDGWRHLRFMLLFKPAWTFLLPGAFLALTGVAGMGLLFLRDLAAPAALSAVTSKHMLSFMLLFLLGSQIISMGLAAKIFGFSKRFDHGDVVINLLHRHFQLEKGILLGVLLILASLASFGYLFVSFYGGFWPRLTDVIRFDWAVVGIACAILGVQFIYTSFLLSLFYIKIK